MTPEASIRRAAPTEADDVARVWLASRHASVPAIPPPVHDDDDVRGYFRERVLPTMDVWVAELAGVVVAMMVLEGDWVEQLYVDPAFTGREIGTALLHEAKRERPGGLQLWAFQTNTGARRFYERHGFVAVEHTDGSANEERAPDVRYAWAGGLQP